MKSLSLTVQKLQRRLKLTTDRQTNKQTDRQDKNNMPPIIRSGGIKSHKKIEGIPRSACGVSGDIPIWGKGEAHVTLY